MSVVEVVTPLLGLMVTFATTGSVFATVKETVSELLPPSESLAVALQTMVSPGEEVEVVRVRLAPLPRDVLSVEFVQA